MKMATIYGVRSQDVEALMDLYGIVVDRRKVFEEAEEDARKKAEQHNPPFSTKPFISNHYIELCADAIERGRQDGLIEANP